MTPLRDARPGLTLARRLEPDARTLFLFSAATANPHRIHYDLAWARDVEGRPGLVVHGPLQAAALGALLTDAAGPDGRLAAFSIRQTAPAYHGDAIDLSALVSAVRPGDDGALEVHLELVARIGDLRVAEGTAVVLTPGEAPASER